MPSGPTLAIVWASTMTDRISQRRRRSRSPPPRREQPLDSAQVLLGVDADRGLRGLDHGDRDAILEKAQLLEPLRLLELGGRQAVKRLERSAPIGIEPDVLEHRRADAVAVVRNRELGEIQRMAIGVDDDLVDAGQRLLGVRRADLQ